ncbi:MAG: addiction module protein [Comamonadaceae bacterium]|jgi:putative addiction module killer protein|nr:addiction module protein [Comamonadaceae bacterium]
MGYTDFERADQTAEFRHWLMHLKDPSGKARILMRIDRLMHGNPGDHRHLVEGVCELRIDFGPGYRVYYLRHRQTLLLLLAGGDKSTQSSDIRLALSLARLPRN